MALSLWRGEVLARATGAEVVRYIIKSVEERHNLPPGTIVGRGRTRAIQLAREEAIAESRKLTRFSFPQLARLFGDRDHTTLVSAHQRFKARMGVAP